MRYASFIFLVATCFFLLDARVSCRVHCFNSPLWHRFWVLQILLTFSLCCRFYFVGDEDLLEIIGNSKSIPKLQKHFKKMFAGVTSIILNEEEQIISGISSKEGEEVIRIISRIINLKKKYNSLYGDIIFRHQMFKMVDNMWS